MADKFVYSTTGGLFLRSLDQLTAKLIPGSGGNPERPFFSPDGKWIGYFCRADGQLKKIAISGGTAVTLTGASSMGSFSWMADDSIVYGQPGKGIVRISANGGNPEAVVTEEKMNIAHPQVLSDGKYLLFSKITPQPLKIMLQQLKSGKREGLFSGDTPRYLPTGHIVYALRDTIFAVPFDLKSMRTTGGPVPVVENVLVRGAAPQWAISDSGTLAYVPGSADMRPQLSLVWVDRNGREEPLAAPLNFYVSPRISPDGTRVAMGAWYGAGGVDICVWSLARKTLTRLTFDPAEEDFPLWSPDGKRIAFYSLREGNSGVYLKAADGTGSDELLMPSSIAQVYPGSWSGDGKTLLTQESASATMDFYIGALPLGGERKWKLLLQERHMVVQPRISSNGRWLAYTSNESGRNEIYVHPYPDVSTGKWQVSTEGGDSPLWSQDGHELFYRNGDEVMAVPVKTDPSFSMETPKILFKGTYVTANFNMGTLELNPWDISPDGKHFLMMKESGANASAGEGPRKINVVLNWFEELKQRVPVK